MTATHVDFVPEPETREGLPASALLVHLRALLHGNSGPKAFCNVELRGPRWRIAECRLHEGHEGKHVDPCQGVRW